MRRDGLASGGEAHSVTPTPPGSRKKEGGGLLLGRLLGGSPERPFHTGPARCGRRLVLYVPPSVRKSSVPEVTRERKSPPDPLGVLRLRLLVLGHLGGLPRTMRGGWPNSTS